MNDMDDKQINEMLKKAEQEARENVATGNDAGHIALISDLRSLLAEAEDCEFHDQLNTKYATPKVELHKKLLAIDSAMQDGKYDN